MEKERREKLKKILKKILIPLSILMLSPFISFYISYQTNGEYSLLGPMPRVDIELCSKKNIDFRIKKGVRSTSQIEFFSKTKSNELLWKINFFYNSDTKSIKYLNYGEVPEGDVFQVFPNVGFDDGDLSYYEQQTANEISRKGLRPRILDENEIVAVKIQSYCGHGFEQPNCQETREFIYSQGSFTPPYEKQ